MAVLPSISGEEAVKVFLKAGWQRKRQESSHVILGKPGHFATLSVPQHEVLAKGTLRRLIRDSGMTVDEFVALLKG